MVATGHRYERTHLLCYLEFAQNIPLLSIEWSKGARGQCIVGRFDTHVDTERVPWGAVELHMAQEESVVERRVRGGVYSPGA